MGFSPFGGFESIFFSVIPVIIAIGFVFVFGTIIIRAVTGAKQWKRNNESAVLTVDAIVVTKRTDVHHYRHNSTGTDNMHHMSSSTIYYATFEVLSGDRLELIVPNKEFGMLVERDKGKLTFQGTRYLGFERIKM